MNKKTLSIGVLLINLGTPDAPTTKSVRRYLKEFLWDKRILDIFWLFRLLLLYCIILPFRTKYSAKLYQKIWMQEGSPLLVWSKRCQTKLTQKLNKNYIVHTAMRYGNPSIKNGIDFLISKNISRLIIVPMFPQYAASTTGSVIEKTSQYLNSKWHIPPYEFVAPFFQNDYFIHAQKELIQETQNSFKPDFILFSYHSLPVRHLKKTTDTFLVPVVKPRDDSRGVTCCDLFNEKNHFCYRAQCFETTRLIAQACNLSSHQFTTSFQSQFGKGQWILPNTQNILDELYKNGVRKLAVICPGFVVDCLETLEEIGIRLRAQWFSIGGTDFTLIQSLNDRDTWITCIQNIIRTEYSISPFG